MDMPIWANKLDMELIRVSANKYSLDPNVVAAMIMTESNGNTWAFRYEKHTDRYTRHVASHARILLISQDSERMAQMTSWGLMQVMGFKAREMGYEGYLPQLCIPSIGIDIGCKTLKWFLDREKGNYYRAIASYNAGSVRMVDGKAANEAYVIKVQGFVNQLAEPNQIIMG